MLREIGFIEIRQNKQGGGALLFESAKRKICVRLNGKLSRFQKTVEFNKYPFPNNAGYNMTSFRFKCAACGHSCNRMLGDSLMPDEDTPPEKIKFMVDDKIFSLFCTNSHCHSYTIFCHERALEYYQKKYNK